RVVRGGFAREGVGQKAGVVPGSASASQATGKFVPHQDLLPQTEVLSASLAPASQATAEFPPPNGASPAGASQGTAGFLPQDLVPQTADGTKALPATLDHIPGPAPSPPAASPLLAPPVAPRR